MKPKLVYQKRDQMPALEQFGAAVEYFPGYINLSPEPHGVDTLLISFVAQGTGQHWMNDAVYPESPGSLGITNYGEIHSVVTEPGGMDIYNLYLDPRVHPLPPIPFEFSKTLQALFASREQFRHSLNRSIHLHFDDPSLPLHCLKTMHQEMLHPSAGTATVIDAMLRTFLVACCRNSLEQGAVPSLSAKAPPPAWLIDTCRFLEENYQDPISLDQLAARSQVSKGYICRAFKKQIGLSMVEYLTECRVQAAMRLLQNTDDKILSVALDSGFGNLSHFNRIFKKLTGRSPSEHRKKYRYHRES